MKVTSGIGQLLSSIHSRYGNSCASFKPVAPGERTKWSIQCQETFQKLKDILKSAPLLAHYNSVKPVYLAVDASLFGLGAALSHVTEDQEPRPITFASHTCLQVRENIP